MDQSGAGCITPIPWSPWYRYGKSNYTSPSGFGGFPRLIPGDRGITITYIYIHTLYRCSLQGTHLLFALAVLYYI